MPPVSKGSGPKSKKPAGPNKRSNARLFAVQALYELDLGERPQALVIKDYRETKLDGHEIDDDHYGPADKGLFQLIVEGVGKRKDEIDAQLLAALPEGRELARMESILRALLRAGIFELLQNDGTPVKVVINEYLDLAHAFFAGTEPKLVNGILDKAASTLRSAEMARVKTLA